MSCTNLINSHFTDQSSLDSWKNATLTILNQYTTKPSYTADDLNFVVNNIAFFSLLALIIAVPIYRLCCLSTNTDEKSISEIKKNIFKKTEYINI